MIDIAAQIGATGREVTEADGLVRVLLTRDYDAAPADVWDALTDPERLLRWFLPITGDLTVGGRFQLEGNAGGEILHCEPPTRLKVTFGDSTSLVEVRLVESGPRTRLELEHTVPVAFAGSAAGSLFVGPGWDGAVLGLALYLAGEIADDPVAAANSLETQRFNLASIEAWVAASTGAATAAEIEAGRVAALAQYCPDVKD
ncbi:SRPBCC family protein [Actinokineospora globicatena]|uniref:Activator of HSP90 ATPase n=1 Tax=Actinokineospora globicatena TaxID=103729 RepID=A0A9W6QGB5_9PSEU|nr:SRPBCC family protein [Actinokineospora globicatena]GLW89250.1 activator of HSP90 ATPase [Actinokineospora globicatena]